MNELFAARWREETPCAWISVPALRRPTPRIVEDIAVIGGYLLWRDGPAVGGRGRTVQPGDDLGGPHGRDRLAMQDTLGNILGGLAQQLDDSLEIGDRVRLDDVCGRVVAIQWRHTALPTRKGERVMVPNAQLMKTKFTVLGDKAPGTGGWRRWVWFNFDGEVSRSQVIGAAERAISNADIANVARETGPSCVAMDFAPGSARYALR